MDAKFILLVDIVCKKIHIWQDHFTVFFDWHLKQHVKKIAIIGKVILSKILLKIIQMMKLRETGVKLNFFEKS